MDIFYKKIAVVAGVLCAFFLLPCQAYANTSPWTIRQEASSATCSQGKSTTVGIYLESQDSDAVLEISSIQGSVEYDTGLFTVESSDIIPASKAEVSFSAETGSFKVAYADSAVLKSGRELLRIQFHAGKKASTGETTVCVTGLSWEGKNIGSVENHVPLEITISGTENSLLGDVNLDGKVDKTDAKYIVQYYNGYRILNSSQKKNADMNGDGKIDLLDSKLILDQCKEESTGTANGGTETVYEAFYIDVLDSKEVNGTTFSYQFPDYYDGVLQKSGLFVSIKGGQEQKLPVDGLTPYICTDGKVLYYCLPAYDDSGDGAETGYYRINVDGTGNEKVFSETASADIAGAYGDRVYYDRFENGTQEFYVYDKGTGKKKKLAKDTGLKAINYGRYFYLGKDVVGDKKLDTIRIYDAKTRKFIGNRKKVLAMKIIKKKLFYIQKRGSRMSLMKCGLDGKSTSTVIKDLKIKKEWYVAIDDNAVVYMNAKDKLITKKF